MNVTQALIDVGVLRIQRFIAPERCAEVLREVRRSTDAYAGTVLDTESGYPVPVVDHGTRKARHVKVSDETKSYLRARMEELMPIVAARFRKPLTGVQDPQCIAYGAGDFFQFHRDTDGSATEPPHVRARKVAAVLFLNDEGATGPGETGYDGGALQFYAHDLVPGPEYAASALSVHGRAGLLVAFDPAVRHQVTPIDRGERVTVVAWYT